MIIPQDQGGGRIAFVVPALLPESVERAPVTGVTPVVVHLACYTGSPLLRHNHVSQEKLSKRCTLPTGLFEQVGGEEGLFRV